MPVGVREQVQVATAGRRFALTRAEPAGGRGTPTLLLHGVPQTARAVLPLLNELAADRLVLAPDLPGLGGSEVGEPYDTASLAAELAALVLAETDRFGRPGPVDVVGHDWGGVLGLALAGHRPDLVRRLVVVAAPYRRLGSRAAHVPFFALPLLPEAVFRLGGTTLPRAMVRSTWQANRAPDPAALRVDATAYADPRRVTAMLGYYRAAVRGRVGRIRDLLPPVRCERHLVVWGAADPVLPLSVGESVVRDLGADTTLVSLPGVGHWPLDEAPEVVVPLVADFLREPVGERPPSAPPDDEG